MNTNLEMQRAYNFVQKNNFTEAEKILDKIVAKKKDFLPALVNLAIVKIRLNKLKEAIQCFENSLSIKIDLPVVKNYLNLLAQTGNWKKLNQYYQQLKKNNLSDVDIELLNIKALRQIDTKENVYKFIESIILEYPKNLNILISYSYTCNFYQDFERALKINLQAIKHSPNDFMVNYNLGITYSNLENPKDSIKYLKKAEELKTDENLFDLHITLSAQYIKLFELENAMLEINKCRAIDPYNSLIVYQEGSLKSQSGEFEEAEKLLEKVVSENSAHSDANYLLGLLYLKQGKYNEAARFYRYRVIKPIKKFGYYNDLELPEINEESTVLIAWEQGIGDQLLYFRLISEFSKRVKKIYYFSSEKLISLLRLNYKNIEIINQNKLPEIEQIQNIIKINIGSLLHYVKDIPSKLKLERDLEVDQKILRAYKAKYKDKIIIGLSWKSKNESSGTDKSFDLIELLRNIRNPSNYIFICLQYGDVRKELNQIKSELDIEIEYEKDLDYYNDIYRLAGLIKICDEVITCSNVTAHLSGSLGVSTRILLPKFKNRLWYWYQDDKKSIWYRSITKYVQDKQGDWETVIKKLVVDLENKFK